MSDFQQLTTTIKGNAAEQWVITYLESIGYKLLWETGHQSTPFDGIGWSGESVSNLFEVKCKCATRYRSYSIHENDLEVYERAEKKENKQMLILYVDPSLEVLNITTTKWIRESLAIRSFDKVEKKYLIYFTKFKQSANLPQNLVEQLTNIILK